MMNMPYEVILERIKEKSGLSESEIIQRIDKKLDQLSGLISKEGAAHILANELGIKLFETPKDIKIKDVLEGMRNVDLAGKIQQIFEVREFKTEKGSGKVGSFMLADETGSIRTVCWYDQTEIINKLVKDLTVKISGGYIRNNNNRKELHINERSKVIINPEGVTIGEIKTLTSTRKKLSELVENENDIEVFATIVQVFEPRFFEICPECNRRAKPREAGFFCEEHMKVNPDYSYVVNLLLDDGTETTRTIFFAKQLEKLIKKNKEEILTYKENLEDFEQIKTDLLGKTIKVVGRVRKNEMFARLEIISQLVFPDIDPDEEIKRLAAEQKTETTPQENQQEQSQTETTQPTTKEPQPTTQENQQEQSQTETTQPTTQETTSEQSNNPDNAL